ncbi:MAG: malate/lactate/ureidoglycolate dehydrogenase [Betaproteobacteria bacterium]|jgi:hydroxycarboxylate dehydrogenase B|nr:malate/lactate/ureidoglycolate dehydrogenase [Betaproteobacteria bacterium]NBP45023.1 malate/lactate/ureidoglycolate dehydrogenase [Betaproteobacteria bacterium]
MTHRIRSDELTQRVSAMFVAAGTSPERAHTVAANLVLANLSGHDSHGVGMAPRYVDAIAEGRLQPNASVRVQLDSGMLLGLDGQGGYGQVVGEQAMHLAFERVRQHGACIMALAHAHHLGRIGHFAEMAVAQGWVSLHFVSVFSRPVVAPYHGGDGRFGTNPCCIGIPLGSGDAVREPFVLDFATSRVAQGKMRVAHNEGRRVPEGYLIDEHGHPTTDPGVVVVPQSNGRYGALMTFGDHKGFGMAVACELLGGALTGAGTWHQEPDARRAVFNGMLTILIDPTRLGTQASFASEALAFVDWLRQSPPAPGTDGVLLAGEPERAARAARGQAGIDIDDTTWAELEGAAQRVHHVF